MATEAACVWAVHVGRRTGLFPHWDACREQVEGYEGAVYRCFKSPKRASEFARNGPAAPDRAEPPLPSEYLRVPGPDPGRDAPEPLTVFVDGYVKKSGGGGDGPPIGGYGVWFGADDPRNVKEKFPLPGHTTERCEIVGVARAIEIVAENDYGPGAELIVAVEGPAVPDGMRRMIAGSGPPRKNSGLFGHLWSVATTCGRPVSILYLPVAKGRRRADAIGAGTQ